MSRFLSHGPLPDDYHIDYIAFPGGGDPEHGQRNGPLGGSLVP